MNATDAAGQLLEATSGWFPRRVDPTAVTNEELALAGLARCRRLLIGMVELHEWGSDLAGAHGRTLYEMWITSLYLFFGGPEALARVRANDAHEQRRQSAAFIDWLSDAEDAGSRRLLEQSQAVLAEPEPNVGKLSLKDMALQVRRLAAEPGKESSDFFEKGYAFLYGPESYMSIHAGLDAMNRQIQGQPPAVSAEGWPYQGANRRLELAIAMVASLANVVAGRLDLERTALDEFAAAWQSHIRA